MLALPFLETTLSTWIQSGRIAFALRKKGITIPITDLVIASLSLENNCKIFTLDLHFNKIPNINIF
jgi:predicted nucleic acid-binding protein